MGGDLGGLVWWALALMALVLIGRFRGKDAVGVFFMR
jgi:hypothetical protein